MMLSYGNVAFYNSVTQLSSCIKYFKQHIVTVSYRKVYIYFVNFGGLRFKKKIGWSKRVRTFECRYQKPMPFHLAILQEIWVGCLNGPTLVWCVVYVRAGFWSSMVSNFPKKGIAIRKYTKKYTEAICPIRT